MHTPRTILFMLLASGALAWGFFQPTRKTESAAVEAIKEQYINGLQDLSTKLEDLEGLVAQSGTTAADIQAGFKAARLAYKRVEYLLEYQAPDFAKTHLNGPNLYWLNETVPDVEEMPPHGFQVVEELLFSGEDGLPQVRDELDFMGKNLAQFVNRRAQDQLYAYQIWEAMRYELLRVFTLGITGFDSPVLLNSLPEAGASLQGMLAAVEAYAPAYELERPAALVQLAQGLQYAIDYLHGSTDFNHFDRITYYKLHHRPLYARCLEAQKASEAYIPSKYYTLPIAVQYEQDELFSTHFLNPAYYAKFRGDNNPLIVRLGKVLFYDPILSGNNKRACASCHNPALGFADGRKTSLAFDMKGSVARNSPTVLNSVFSSHYFHDLRAENIEDQTEHVLLSPQEFNTNYKEATEKIKQSLDYQHLFNEAFGLGEQSINRNTVAFALAEYVRTLNGFNSPFDKYMRGEIKELDARVLRGANLFMGKAGCATCHFSPVFNGTRPPHYIESESEVLGTLANENLQEPVIDEDMGRFGARKQEASIFYRSFKTPTVRNVALTGPYMHNGAFSDLRTVVEFYNQGGGAGLGLYVPNQTLPSDSLNLTETEIDDIVRFMEALTDTTGLTSKPARLPAFAHPALNMRKLGGEY
ncbi:MAG: hypothetical protein HYZ16_09270 [Bacteroidetes bacterium]|nr:hypothetical protein [Bacteroidota bacterium]